MLMPVRRNIDIIQHPSEKCKSFFTHILFSRVVILNAKEHEPTRKGAERFNRIYFFVFVWPEKITETG